MARKKIKAKNRREPTPAWLVEYLISGKEPGIKEPGCLECFQIRGDKIRGGDQVQDVWKKERAGIFKHCKLNTPGQRPWAWWEFDAPEPRLKISGGGLPSHEKYPSVLPCFFMGVSRYFNDIDENDPPIYESEAAYLKRHNLLSKSEELLLSDADFKPVSILEIREKQAE